MKRFRSYVKLHSGKRRSFNAVTMVRMRVAHAIRLGKITQEQIDAARSSVRRSGLIDELSMFSLVGASHDRSDPEQPRPLPQPPLGAISSLLQSHEIPRVFEGLSADVARRLSAAGGNR